MLSLARRAAPVVAEKIGYGNVEFRNGKLQDLGLDLDAVGTWLEAHPVRSTQDLFALEEEQKRLRAEQPLVADDSIDCVVSNCVLNLVTLHDRQQLFTEVFRVLRRGGRVAISDIVCDEDVPAELLADRDLWAGCISGAFREDRLLKAFVDAGFYGVHIVKRDAAPWQVVKGIEFRSVTLVAYKGKQGPCKEGLHAVIYKVCRRCSACSVD